MCSLVLNKLICGVYLNALVYTVHFNIWTVIPWWPFCMLRRLQAKGEFTVLVYFHGRFIVDEIHFRILHFASTVETSFFYFYWHVGMRWDKHITRLLLMMHLCFWSMTFFLSIIDLLSQSTCQKLFTQKYRPCSNYQYSGEAVEIWEG